jgi:hypothetical protein
MKSELEKAFDQIAAAWQHGAVYDPAKVEYARRLVQAQEAALERAIKENTANAEDASRLAGCLECHIVGQPEGYWPISRRALEAHKARALILSNQEEQC